MACFGGVDAPGTSTLCACAEATSTLPGGREGELSQGRAAPSAPALGREVGLRVPAFWSACRGRGQLSPVTRRPEAGGSGMATASGSSDLSGSGAPPPGGEVQAAAAEEEEREVVRVRVKVRLTAGQPAHPGLPGEKKAMAVL